MHRCMVTQLSLLRQPLAVAAGRSCMPFVRVVSNTQLSAPLLRSMRTSTSRSAATTATRVETSASDPAQKTAVAETTNTGTCTGTPAAVKKHKSLVKVYSELSKSKLTLLVASTAAAGYVMGAGAFGVPISACELGSVIAGTSMASAAANTLNQCYEISNDGQMRRTMLRPLPTSRITLQHALGFAGVSATSGFALLYNFASPAAAWMALGNLALYAGVYTPLKQKTTWNTWVGAVVGAVPPMLGWMALPEASLLDPGMWAMGAMLFSWQMPHFMALSWLGRKDYKGAGYQMLASFDARKSAAVSLRHCLYLFGICAAMPMAGMVEWPFLIESAALNAGFTYAGYKFYNQQTVRTARGLFKWSLLYLPALMAFLALHRPAVDKEEKAAAEQPGRPKKECDLA